MTGLLAVLAALGVMGVALIFAYGVHILIEEAKADYVANSVDDPTNAREFATKLVNKKDRKAVVNEWRKEAINKHEALNELEEELTSLYVQDPSIITVSGAEAFAKWQKQSQESLLAYLQKLGSDEVRKIVESNKASRSQLIELTLLGKHFEETCEQIEKAEAKYKRKISEFRKRQELERPSPHSLLGTVLSDPRRSVLKSTPALESSSSNLIFATHDEWKSWFQRNGNKLA